MDIAVHGRHLDLPNGVRQHAVQKVEHLGKYMHDMERAEVLFSDGKKGHLAEPVTCELTIVGRGHVVRTAGSGPEPDAALEVALGKATHRLTKLKDQLVERSRPRHKGEKSAPGDGAGGPAKSPTS